jgi:hypothetical protein
MKNHEKESENLASLKEAFNRSMEKWQLLPPFQFNQPHQNRF